MKAFNNNQKLKDEVVAKIRHHQELDTYIQGKWLDESEKVEDNGYRGCFYGCTMQTNDDPVGRFSEKYHIDKWYCALTENLFEGIPDGEYQKFPLQSIDIIPLGFDFNTIKSPFFYTLLMDEKHGQINYCADNKECEEAIKQCAELFKQDFNEIERSAARSAARSAWSAAESAARSAARSAAESAESAAESAARSAAWSAESAAWSAARSAAESAESAAESAYYIWMRDMLFGLINEHQNN